jgi:hypothetical protein
MRVAVFFLMVLISSGSRASDHCSLNVIVKNSHGQEIDASIRVVEANGRVIRKENEPGGARFCDLGIMPVLVIVGDASCNEVTVRNVPVDLTSEARLHVTYDIDACLADPPPIPVCRLLVRVFAEHGSALAGATVKLLSPVERRLTADAYGRTLLSADFGSRIRAVVSAEGYKETNVEFQCTQNTRLQEKLVILRQ